MNKQELENKIEALEKELAEVKLELQKKDQSKIWKPGLHEKFYYIDQWGDVEDDSYEDYYVDVEQIKFGNYFKTREEAEKQANYQKYTKLLRKYVENTASLWTGKTIIRVNMKCIMTMMIRKL